MKRLLNKLLKIVGALIVAVLRVLSRTLWLVLTAISFRFSELFKSSCAKFAKFIHLLNLKGLPNS